MNHDASAYGLWTLVFFNSAIFLMFGYSFFKPETARDWRTFGAFGAFVLVLLGFLLQWPTLLTLLMFPILLVMYARLAMTEEAEMRKQFAAQYEAWAARTPRFVPSFGQHASPA